MNLVDLLSLCTCIVLLAKLSGCVPCIQTIGANTISCDINPDSKQYCNIHCELVDPDNPTHVFCSHRCWTNIIPCENFTSTDQYQLCCTTPYCNNLTTIPLLPSLTPTQAQSSDSDSTSSSIARPSSYAGDSPTLRHSPTPTNRRPSNPSSNKANKKVSEDLHVHIVIAVSVVIVALVIAVVTGFVAVMWIRQMASQQQNNGLLVTKFRQRTMSLE